MHAMHKVVISVVFVLTNSDIPTERKKRHASIP